MKARSLESLLEALAEQSRQVEAGRLPQRSRLTLLLRSGRSLTGTLLELVQERSGPVLTLSLEDGQRRFTAPDIAFVPTSALEAVIVLEAEDLNKPPEPGPIPGKLELRRAVRAVQDELQVAGHALEVVLTGSLEEESEREAFNAALEPLGKALSQIGADAMGREALGRVNRIQLELGEEAGVRREGETLQTLQISVPRAYLNRPDIAGWKDLLEAAL